MRVHYMHRHTVISWLLYLGRQVAAVATPGRIEFQQPDIALGRACREAALGDLLHIGVAVVQACAAAMLPAPRSTPRPPASLQRIHSGQWSAPLWATTSLSLSTCAKLFCWSHRLSAMLPQVTLYHDATIVSIWCNKIGAKHLQI